MVEWKEINKRLTSELGICSCQRKLKSIIDCLVQIKRKTESGNRVYNGQEFLICALLEEKGLIEHGINCEYPLLWNDDFWQWIEETAKNPDLCDN